MAAEETSAQNADDIKWIAKCMEDNKDQGQTPEVVRKYGSLVISGVVKFIRNNNI